MRNSRSLLPRVRCLLVLTGTLLTSGGVPWSTAAAQILPQETPEQMRQMADSLFQTQFPIDDGAAEITVPNEAQRNAAPLEFATFLMELAERADRATEQGKHAVAAKYLRALAAAVPDRSASFSALCQSYELAGDAANALQACATALQRPGVTLTDFARYIRLALAQPGAIPADRLRDLDALLHHLDTIGADTVTTARLRCDLGVKLRDVQRLTQCTSILHAKAGDDLKTLGYEWALSMERGEYDAALAILPRAAKAGMRPDAVQAMEEASRAARSPIRHALSSALSSSGPTSVGAALLALVLSALLLIRRGRRDATRQAQA